MSARKLIPVSLLRPVTLQTKATRLDLTPEAVKICRNGIEFRTPHPFPQWAEMTVALETPAGENKVQCHGVIVACTGSRHGGYTVSMVFTDLSKQAEASLQSLAYSGLA